MATSAFRVHRGNSAMRFDQRSRTGHPTVFFTIPDSAAGDTNGEGVGEVSKDRSSGREGGASRAWTVGSGGQLMPTCMLGLRLRQGVWYSPHPWFCEFSLATEAWI